MAVKHEIGAIMEIQEISFLERFVSCIQNFLLNLPKGVPVSIKCVFKHQDFLTNNYLQVKDNIKQSSFTLKG